MKTAQSYLALAFATCVIVAIYLSVRDIPLPDTARMDVIRPGSRLEADAATYAWYASLDLLVALGAVWFARPPTV